MANSTAQNLDRDNIKLAEVPADTWILFAHRSEAVLYASDGGVKNFRFIERIEHPEGRLQNRELQTDREGASMAEGSANYPRHGMVNKGEAAFHETQVFARYLAEVLRLGRARNLFTHLALFAEPRFLGELRASLDNQTQSLITVAVDREYRDIPDENLKNKIREHFLGNTIVNPD